MDLRITIYLNSFVSSLRQADRHRNEKGHLQYSPPPVNMQLTLPNADVWETLDHIHSFARTEHYKKELLHV
jgi:hypothetical protein